MKMIEHSVRLANGAAVNLEEMAAGHRLVAELPRVSVRVAAFGRGASARGRHPRWLHKACNFEYLGSTAAGLIQFRAPTLGSVAPRVFSGQRELFSDSFSPDETAFTLLEKGLSDVVSDVAESDRYDDVFLKRFAILGTRAFHSGITKVTLDGLDGRKALELDPSAPDCARHLLERTPPAQRVRLAGKLTLLRTRGNAFEVTVPNEGTVRCALVGAAVETIKDHFNKDVAVTGTAFYRPSGALLRIDADIVHAARDGDKIFCHLPVARRELIPREAVAPRPSGKSWLGEIVGKWPGDETEEELLRALREIG